MLTHSKIRIPSGQTNRREPTTRAARIYWTLGNLLLVSGLYLLVYVGGLYLYVEHLRLAARGDNDIEMPPLVITAPSMAVPDLSSLNQARSTSVPAGSGLPLIEPPDPGVLASPLPAPLPADHVSHVERLVIPSIQVDAKVIEVGWDVIEQGEQRIAVWQVAEFAVGHHKGSANPGEENNIVLAGHVGGYGKVFLDLYYVQPGDPIIVYSEGREHLYIVTERLVVDEEGVPAEQRLANAQLIGPTDREMVTMVTCWPATGPNRFHQRVIVRAEPPGRAYGGQP
ncbi:MAG: sortase [Chloroflexia bacterium]|nr:sortase [Chloroflexia bacterium]